MNKILICFVLLLLCGVVSAQTFTLPHESATHEGTWLQWPHRYEYGLFYRKTLDPTWVAMTAALVNSEKVHIVAYDDSEQTRIIGLLNDAGIPLSNVDFYVFPTNDVWVRDNGPIYVRDSIGNLQIEDYGFNGWGGDYNFNLDDPIPGEIAAATGLPLIDLDTTITVEGGAFDVDGNGVFMACRSSILSQSPPNSVRNPGMTQQEAESIFSKYLGVTKFIWLDGEVGDPLDVTDFHIDGFAKFVNDSVMVTMSDSDLTYWGASASDISTLDNASNIYNVTYQKVYVPLTKNDVVTTYFHDLGFKGSYVNYYVANTVVLVPNYDDTNDSVANAIIQSQYPGRTVVGIDVRNLYAYGGMVHCVTQQQPVAAIPTGSNEVSDPHQISISFWPNPFSTQTTLYANQNLDDVTLILMNCIGKPVKLMNHVSGSHITISRGQLDAGLYAVLITRNGQVLASKMISIAD